MAEKRQPLADYRARRDFALTPEPADARPKAASRKGGGAAPGSLSFVVQKHAATRLHYDLRLEWNGVLLSWAVPKGPSFDPAEKRIAVRTEDHPLSYATFEGTIPARQYGAGEMIVWDRGTWRPEVDVDRGLVDGKLVFSLDGEKLAGLWELVRIRKPGEKQEPWILFKKRDAWAQPLAAYDVVRALPDSVIARPLGPLRTRDPRAGGNEAKAKATPATAVLDAVAVAAALASAPLAEAPARLSPQLATLAASPAAVRGEGWLHEIKFDGYRVLAHYGAGKVRLHTRQGHDWTAKMKSLAAVFETLEIESGWLDGELVVLGADGTPNFNALQNAFDGAATGGIVCFLFDVPFLDGRDLRALPLDTRRAILQARLEGHETERLRLSAAFEGDAASVLASACRMRLEGIVCKRRDSAYASKRTGSWLKLKCQRRERFVVGGWTDREAAVGEVGSLLLGTREAGSGPLRWVGNVGTGWDARAAASMRRTLAAFETDRSPFDADHAPERGRWSRKAGGGEHWVRPVVEVEVGFAEWTPDGHIRHPVFHALHGPDAAVAKPLSVAISHPTRVIDASTGLTKLDLVRWYESVADRILPHLAGRPVSLVRGPSGVGGTLFFQKHGEKLGIPGIVELDPALWPGHPAMLEVGNVEALIGCAQMNVIEFHTWNSIVGRIDRPDRVIFDLDPGEGVAWAQVQEAALLVRALLDELGLASWLKTSGGKGLHVVVPIDATKRSSLDYDAVKAFSRRAVQHLAKTIPQRFVARSGGANRVGRIFVDWIRNGRGATTAAAFSARARPGLGVSMPVSWEALPSLTGGAQWSIADAREHLSFEAVDPWAGYRACRQTLAAAIRRLDA